MWDLATAKTMLGIAPGDTTQDAALTSVMDRLIGELEDLLGRGLLLKSTTETFYHVGSRQLRLNRYPIERVDSPACRIVHHRAGWIELDQGLAPDGAVTVTYTGGFKVLPAALERCLWEILHVVWGGVDHTTGLPVAGQGGGTVLQGSGDISSVTIDGMTLRYDVGSTVAGGGGESAAAAAEKEWGWLAPWATVLSIYRSESAPGVAIA